MRSVYIIGAAGTGKSTFTDRLLTAGEWECGPHEDFHTVLNSAGRPEILRGHILYHHGAEAGFYLGRRRDSFPGTDGLSRSTVIAGESWLRGLPPWPFMLGEGATFATRGFLDTLQETTDLLLVHLLAGPEALAERHAARGSDQDPRFVKATLTRSSNTAERMRAAGATVLDVTTEDTEALSLAEDLCLAHLRVGS